jgi:hypothetical protein
LALLADAAGVGQSTVPQSQKFFGCNNIFRKSTILEIGGYDEMMRTNAEDTDNSRRLRDDG